MKQHNCLLSSLMVGKPIGLSLLVLPWVSCVVEVSSWLRLESSERPAHSHSWWSMQAVSWNTYAWPLHVAWASSQHGGWVPRTRSQESQVGAALLFIIHLHESCSTTFPCMRVPRTSPTLRERSKTSPLDGGLLKNLWIWFKTTPGPHFLFQQARQLDQ